MYRAFKGIPKKIRQQAFEALLAGGYATPNDDSVVASPLNRKVTILVHGFNQGWEFPCCPFGAVNLAYGLKAQSCFIKGSYFTTGGLLMPGDGWTEREILSAADSSLQIDPQAVNHFMVANDRGLFDTPAKLARAMGANYHPTTTK